MKLKREDILHISRLSRLGLSEEEIEKAGKELSDLLGHFEVLQKVDTENVPPTAQSIDLVNVMKEDEVKDSMPREDVLLNAPCKEGNYIKVKAVLE